MATLNFDVKETNKRLKAGFRIFPAVVCYRLNNKTKRRTFQCKAQAQSFYNSILTEQKNYGTSFYKDLKPAEADLAYRAFDRAKTNGYDIMTALAFYEAQTKLSGNAIVSDIAEKIIALKWAGTTQQKYKINFERAINRFSAAHKGKELDSFTAEDIDKYVADPEKGWNIITQDYNKRLISHFFNLCKEQKYCAANPVKRMDKKTFKRVAPAYIQFYKPEEVRIILRQAAAGRPEMVVPLALTFFNGLRIDTSCRMIENDIHLDYDSIYIPDAIDKSYGRTINLMPNCKAWLEMFLPKSKMPIFGNDKLIPAQLASQNYDKFTAWCLDVQSEWGTKNKYLTRHTVKNGGKWIKNGHRHSFCTYYLAMHNDQHKTAFMAGNTPQMIQEHYDGRLFKKDLCREYFDITPENTL